MRDLPTLGPHRLPAVNDAEWSTYGKLVLMGNCRSYDAAGMDLPR